MTRLDPMQFAAEMGIPESERQDFVESTERLELMVRIESEFPVLDHQIEKKYRAWIDENPEALPEEHGEFVDKMLDEVKALLHNPWLSALIASEAEQYGEFVKENYGAMSGWQPIDYAKELLHYRSERNRYRRVVAAMDAMARVDNALKIAKSEG